MVAGPRNQRLKGRSLATGPLLKTSGRWGILFAFEEGSDKVIRKGGSVADIEAQLVKKKTLRL